MTDSRKKLVIGLTGGIGCGKTTVADIFSTLGAEVIDADVLAKQAVALGTPIYNAIIKRLGDNYLLENKELNRRKLRELAFADHAFRQWLEQQIHPQVRQQMQQAISVSQAPYCILVIPLLIETLPNPLINRILVITADEAVKINRIIERDQCSSELAKKMIAAQLSDQARLTHADDQLSNNGSINELRQQVKSLHAQYLELSDAICRQ